MSGSEVRGPVRQESLAEEKGGSEPETSESNPRVKVPTGQGGGRQPEASLASRAP
jgi:hypothetical protein